MYCLSNEKINQLNSFLFNDWKFDYSYYQSTKSKQLEKVVNLSESSCLVCSIWYTDSNIPRLTATFKNFRIVSHNIDGKTINYTVYTCNNIFTSCKSLNLDFRQPRKNFNLLKKYTERLDNNFILDFCEDLIVANTQDKVAVTEAGETAN